jgi:CRP-like cAMP-binding protein
MIKNVTWLFKEEPFRLPALANMTRELAAQQLRAHIHQIIPLSDEEFQQTLAFFDIRTYKKHHFVVQEGDLAPYDHFVLKGLLKSYYVDDKGKMHILQFAMEDWWISDPHAFHNRSAATMNIDCVEDSMVYYISLSKREQLCAEVPKMQYFFLKKTTTGFLALQKRLLALMRNNAEQRFEQFKQQYPEFGKRLPKALIASYLGVSRETLSRLSGS